MSIDDVTDCEAKVLLDIEKHRVDDTYWEYPTLGGSIVIPLISFDKREEFLLDISRRKIDLHKCKYQSRARQCVVLARLDLGGAPHRNPDGEEIQCPHLHLYRQGFGDKWAIPAPLDTFINTNDPWTTLFAFMKYCNIVKQPIIKRGLFT